MQFWRPVGAPSLHPNAPDSSKRTTPLTGNPQHRQSSVLAPCHAPWTPRACQALAGWPSDQWRSPAPGGSIAIHQKNRPHRFPPSRHLHINSCTILVASVHGMFQLTVRRFPLHAASYGEWLVSSTRGPLRPCRRNEGLLEIPVASPSPEKFIIHNLEPSSRDYDRLHPDITIRSFSGQEAW